MVFRFLLRFLSNNEHLVQKLSESYPFRRAAQWVVIIFYRGKGLVEDTNLHKKLTPEQFRSFIQRFSENIKREIEENRHKFKK